MMNHVQVDRDHLWLRWVWLGVWVMGAVGCSDWVDVPLDFQPAVTSVELETNRDESRYEWPLSRSGYIVAKPPQLSFVGSFTEPIKVPDQSKAAIVPWSEEDVHADVHEMLRQLYEPMDTDIQVHATIPRSEFAGPHAFDVSASGERVVVIGKSELILYNAKDGSRVGKRSFEDLGLPIGANYIAVRFAGSSDDMLIASEKDLYRIDKQTGVVSGEVTGCGEPFSQWIVNEEDTITVMLTESGKLFSGDSSLEEFGLLPETRSESLKQVSLSPDGTRIVLNSSNVCETLVLEGTQVLDRIRHGFSSPEGEVFVSGGYNKDIWFNRDQVVYADINANGKDKAKRKRLMWRPLSMYDCSPNKGNSWYVSIGERFHEGKEQLILYDWRPENGSHSAAFPLSEVPSRVALGSNGRSLALLMREGLQICTRKCWERWSDWDSYGVRYTWMAERQLEHFDQLAQVVAKQQRLIRGMTPAQVYLGIVDLMSSRWASVRKQEDQAEFAQAFEDWRAKESTLSIIVEAHRLDQEAWEARGGGYASTVSQNGWEVFQNNLDRAIELLTPVCEQEQPPYPALSMLISASLNRNRGFEGVDPWCRQMVQLYPGEMEPHLNIAHKQTPQWGGEVDDTINYILSVSKIFERRVGDLLYNRLIERSMRDSFNSSYGPAWVGFDPKRVARGFDEHLKQRFGDTWASNHYLWYVRSTLMNRSGDEATSDRMLLYLMDSMPMFPSKDAHGHLPADPAYVAKRVQYLRGQKKGKSK